MGLNNSVFSYLLLCMENNTLNAPVKRRNQWEMERLFSSNGPIYHVCSKPLVDALLFYEAEDKKAALSFLAVTNAELDARLLAYSLMSNHFHILIGCRNPAFYYELLVQKLELYLSRHGHPGIRLPKEPTIVPIQSLKQFRDTLAYIIRNEYVINPNNNPLSCLWCSGFLYFNDMLAPILSSLKTARAGDASSFVLRKITRSRDYKLPGAALIWNDIVLPSSFVDFKFAESMFEDARQFTVHVFKNVEALVEVAISIGETPITPDEELSRIIFAHCKRTWDKRPDELSRTQLIELVKHIKYTYRSSNAQVARLTGMSPKEVDILFPLGAKR